jgi:hypothetical protein
MTTEQAKEIFNNAIKNSKNADQIANIEICREYFTNPEFKKFLEDITFTVNHKEL